METYPPGLRQGFAKPLLVMKLSFIFILAASFSVNARSYSQKISISVQNVPVQQVFGIIRSQSGYQFLYTDKVISKSRPTLKQVWAYDCIANT